MQCKRAKSQLAKGNKIVSAAEAVRLIKDGDTLATGGFIGIGFAENLAIALEQRFLGCDPQSAAGGPYGLTLVYAGGQGDGKDRGLNHFGHQGLNDHPPIAGGRELWGFPKKLANPKLETEIDTLVGTLDYGKVRIAKATMGFKHRVANHADVLASLAAPNFLLKIIPHVDGTTRICELVRYHTTQITLKGAWTGPGSLELHPHALAPVSELPVLKIVSALHLVADLTLDLGEVVYDYLA